MELSQKEIISRAEELLATSPTKLPEFLFTYSNNFTISDSQSDMAYNRLLAIGYVACNDYIKAEDHINICINTESNSLDYYYLLTVIYSSMYDYKNVLTSAELYISMIEKSTDLNDNYLISKSHKCKIYNLLGVAQMNSGNFEEANSNFLNGIHIDKESKISYINMVRLLLNQSDFENVSTFLDDGLQNCTQIQELQLLQKMVQTETDEQFS